MNLRSHRGAATMLVLVSVVVGCALATWWFTRAGDQPWSQTRGDLHGAGDVVLDTRVLVPRGVDAARPAPAVLLAHGLGATQDDVADTARSLAGAGYVVLTWTSRGHRGSGDRIGIAAPDGEVADAAALVDELATRPEVQLDGEGDPRVAMVGVSHGAGVSVLAAARDRRIDAVVSIFGWYDLRTVLEPDRSRPLPEAGPGVLELRWGSELFSSGSAIRRRPTPCGAIERAACRAWARSVARGALTSDARAMLAERSPASVADRLRAPTLVVQGQMDSLFELDQSIALADALQRADVPHRVEWLRAGHDLPLDPRRRDHVDEAVERWLDRHLLRDDDVDPGPRLLVQLGAGRGYGAADQVPPRTRQRALELEPADRVDEAGFVRFAAPVGGLPAATTTVPGLGDVSGVSLGFATPAGQRARFDGEPVADGLEIVGTPRVRLRFSGDVAHGIAFVHLVDISPNGRRIIPRGLVAPVRLAGLPPLDRPGAGRLVTVDLPTIAWRLAPGHRLGLEVSSTDAGFLAPAEPATFGVSIDAGRQGGLRVPQALGLEPVADDDGPVRDWTHVLAAAATLLVAGGLLAWLADLRSTRRIRRGHDPGHDLVLVVQGLGKRYRGGRVAVDDVSFQVAPGSVVGLVGPNGAGKTTIIRMLLGLVHPSRGGATLFGRPVRPGAEVLDRVGALVEGPGLVPHLSGREHLRRYWSAIGRDPEKAGIDDAIARVGLTADAHRPVRTWSHGMRQRLGIAQALLGRPELVLLDEPANGLDPEQIIQLRELIGQLAAQGRTVLVSSHQLDELQRVCTDVVLIAEGRVLATGSLDEVTAGHASLEAAFLARVEASRA